MPRKPDKFERMVKSVGFIEAWEGDRKIYEADAIKLLRRQYRAMVDIIKEATRYDEFEEQYPEHRYGIAMMEKGRYINRERVLDDLNEYKR